MKTIPLSGENGAGKYALVDNEDYPILSRVTWCLAEHGYPRTQKSLYMHSLIMGFPQNSIIDHIDRDRLNNQKSNLRLVNAQKNAINRSPNSTKLWKGVSRRDRLVSRPWQASIGKTVDGKSKTYHIGYFATAEEAAQAYDTKALELFGEYARMNFPTATGGLTST